MSLMKINYVHNELKKLTPVIINLISNYNNNFKEYDFRYKEVENSFIKKEQDIQESGKLDMLYDVIQEKRVYTEPFDDLKSFAQFQNELMLVKHTALIENMIISIFRCLINLLQKYDYHNKYFIEQKNFSDSFVAVNKINELTDSKINLCKINCWDLIKTMKIIRNPIAHGEALFTISYRRAKKFNKEIDMINMFSKVNEGVLKDKHSSLLQPTYENKSKWFCHLSSDIKNLLKLNKKCLEFVEETKKLYLSYGNENNLAVNELYECKAYNKYE
ncbi:MAG: hypothetical protein WA945_04290 [Arcobacteraceae bacterium]